MADTNVVPVKTLDKVSLVPKTGERTNPSGRIRNVKKSKVTTGNSIKAITIFMTKRSFIGHPFVVIAQDNQCQNTFFSRLSPCAQ
jgi:hypothetical protein